MKELAKWAWLILLSILFFGWWTFVIIAVEIVALFIYYLVILPKIEKRRYEKLHQSTSNVAEKKAQKSFFHKEENKAKLAPTFKKKLSNEAAELELQNALKKNPDAVSDITMQGDDKIYRLYWLSKEEPNNDLFDVNFAIRKDCQSMDVTVTNISNKTIEVDWKQFKIGRERALLDGLDWIDFKGDGKIKPCMNSTVSVQPPIYKIGSPVPMFDLDKIKEEELIYKVSLHVKSPATRKFLYTYTIHTKLKVIF